MQSCHLVVFAILPLYKYRIKYTGSRSTYRNEHGIVDQSVLEVLLVNGIFGAKARAVRRCKVHDDAVVLHETIALDDVRDTSAGQTPCASKAALDLLVHERIPTYPIGEFERGLKGPWICGRNGAQENSTYF
jgi:hypothetical protein